jgi:hypothetical protein
MLNRCSFRLPALAAVAILVGLAVSTMQPLQAQDKVKAFHLKIAFYELYNLRFARIGGWLSEKGGVSKLKG